MAVNVARPDADKAFWVWKHYNPRQASDPRTAFAAGYNRAYRDAISDTAQFAGLQQALEQLSFLLEDARIEREAIREWQEQ